MDVARSNRLMAVDIGNSRIKIGLFPEPSSSEIPVPTSTGEFDLAQWDRRQIEEWLAEKVDPSRPDRVSWVVGSVNGPALKLFGELVHTVYHNHVTELSWTDLALKIDLDRPDCVGIDRLLGAVAVNQLRDTGRAAIVMDWGSAMTIDLIQSDGSFVGGAISPGSAMSAHALNRQTDLLPLVLPNLTADPPPPLGRSTEQAICAGLFWGAVGTMRELETQLTLGLREPPEVFVTGGRAAAMAAELLGEDTRYVPHLVLSGIALTHSVFCS